MLDKIKLKRAHGKYFDPNLLSKSIQIPYETRLGETFYFELICGHKIHFSCRLQTLFSNLQDVSEVLKISNSYVIQSKSL